MRKKTKREQHGCEKNDTCYHKCMNPWQKHGKVEISGTIHERSPNWNCEPNGETKHRSHRSRLQLIPPLASFGSQFQFLLFSWIFPEVSTLPCFC